MMNHRFIHFGLGLGLLVAMTLGLGGCGGGGHNLMAEPGRVDFGQVFVGHGVTRSVAWTNEGPKPTTLTDVELADSRGVFAFAGERGPLQEPIKLAKGGGSPEIRLRFEPRTYRQDSASVSPITEPTGQAQTIELAGQGVYVKGSDKLELDSPGLSPSQPLDMGQVPTTGDASHAHEIRLRNLSDQNLVLRPNWQHGDQGFALKGHPKTIRIPYGQSKTLTVTFTPSHTALQTDTLTLSDSHRHQIAGFVVTGIGKPRPKR